MNKINNLNNPYLAQSNKIDAQKTQKPQTLEEVCIDSMQKLAKRAEYEVPQNGKFYNVYEEFEIPDSRLEGQFSVIFDALNPKDLRAVYLGVSSKYSDEMHSYCEFEGNKQEVIEYLKDTSNIEELLKDIKRLSCSIDD